MAEPYEGKIGISTEEAVRNLRELETELEQVTEGMDGAGSSGSNFAQNLTAAVVTVQAAFAAISKLADAVKGAADEFESVPLNKIEDFGAHQNQYYQLEISYFKKSPQSFHGSFLPQP